MLYPLWACLITIQKKMNPLLLWFSDAALMESPARVLATISLFAFTDYISEQEKHQKDIRNISKNILL